MSVAYKQDLLKIYVCKRDVPGIDAESAARIPSGTPGFGSSLRDLCRAPDAHLGHTMHLGRAREPDLNLLRNPDELQAASLSKDNCPNRVQNAPKCLQLSLLPPGTR